MKTTGILAAALLFAAAAYAQDPAGETAEGQEETAAAGEEEPMPRVATSRGLGAMDELVLERTEVTGNRELPKVLYIVPWRKSDPGALTGRPANTLLDEVLAPLDREVFIRQVDYYSDLYDDSAPIEGQETPGAGASSSRVSGARDAGN